MLWEIQRFPLTVALFWLEWSQMRIRSREPFDYIFPLDYFYSHNTAHWQNCSALLYFRPLIFCFLVGLAGLHGRPDQRLRSICSLHGHQPPKVRNKPRKCPNFILHFFLNLLLTWNVLNHMLKYGLYFINLRERALVEFDLGSSYRLLTYPRWIWGNSNQNVHFFIPRHLFGERDAHKVECSTKGQTVQKTNEDKSKEQWYHRKAMLLLYVTVSPNYKSLQSTTHTYSDLIHKSNYDHKILRKHIMYMYIMFTI